MKPGATYRLQLHPGFTFADAADVVPYLAHLGITHLYLSPSLQAAPGSSHGYDVVDPTRLNEELGGEEGFAVLRDAAEQAGLGIVLDIVPNHVGLVPTANDWWWDVLRHGPASRYAHHFDIEWGEDRRARVVLPELGASLDAVVASGELHLTVEDDEPRIAYHDHRWPVREGSLAEAGLPLAPASAQRMAAEEPARLLALLDAQHYRLVHWRRGNTELNYRRFFDITTLGGVRIEDPDVFRDTHGRVLELIADGAVDGLRVDHPDGLWDPTGYAERLRDAAPDAWIVFEKILEAGERRRGDWPIDGTVGYEFANLLLGQFVDEASAAAFTDLYDRIVGERQDPERIVDDAKREVVTGLFPAELSRLCRLLASAADELGVATDDETLRAALTEVLVVHPVYRTYVRPDRDEVGAADHHIIEETVARARVRLPDASEALTLIEDLWTLRRRSDTGNDFVWRLQQLTGPVMAKGVEDTTFYRYLRFAAVNEVGGEPSRLGAGLGELHAANTLRQRDWPTSMLSTSTHDTKRSEDVRARLAVCSELPGAWTEAWERFRGGAARHHGQHGPTPNHEYLTFQTAVGAWPIGPDRLVAYLVKAAREEKRATSWLDQDERYERDLEAYARGVLADEQVTQHVQDLVAGIAEPGRLTSLSQTLVKLTSPGVPDIYQGTELEDLSLVDPDNRRPVDFAARARMLGEVGDDPDPDAALDGLASGRAKLEVTHRALRARQRHADAFGPDGTYEPLYAAGDRLDHVIAFVRGGEVVTVAPRRVVALGGAFADWEWGDTTLTLPPGSWHDAMTGEQHEGGELPIAALLARFPVALLERQERP